MLPRHCCRIITVLLILLIEPHIRQLMKPENRMQDTNASLTTSTHSQSTSRCLALYSCFIPMILESQVGPSRECESQSVLWTPLWYTHAQVIFLQIIVVWFPYLLPVLFCSDLTFSTRPPCRPTDQDIHLFILTLPLFLIHVFLFSFLFLWSS